MPGYGARSWDYFEPGHRVAGLEVIERIDDGLTQTTTHYRVRQTCCDGESIWTHHAIKKRAAKANTECKTCTRQRVARAMGAGNKGGSWAIKKRAKAARGRAVQIESGPWAGLYRLLGPLGHRYGPRGADATIAGGSE